MIVRIVEHPDGDRWDVQSLEWALNFPYWMTEEVFMGDNAKEQALTYVKRLKNPAVVEVK